MEKLGHKIQPENIKIWACDQMKMIDVVRGIEAVSNLDNPSVIVYTNIVPNIDYFQKNHKVLVFDQELLKLHALKFHDLELYDML